MRDLDNVCLEVEHNWEKDYLSVSPEIVQTSTFQFKNFDHYVEVNAHGQHAYTYTRGDNPTLEILEKKIARLEKGECARSYASGMGAISATILSLINKDEHVIIVNTVYGSSVKLIQSLKRFGVESSKIDVCETSEIFDYIQDNTKMIYFESPSSQKFELLDLKMIADVAKEKGIYTVIDNTWSTPLFQNPLEYGIDVVIHSCSKYIGGHSDIVGGIVVTNQKLMKKIDDFGQILVGATMAPMNAWLAIRGLRTLPVRMKSQQETTKQVITYLQNHPCIQHVYHPLVASSSQRALAKTYLKGYSSLLGFELKDANPQIIKTFIDSLNHFTLAYSWGGFESLAMPVFKGNNEEELKQRGLNIGHIRMYLGLEEPELLVEDIKQALEKAYSNH
ncbi:MAG: aminotransferase class I/II-fold pyridoxal phosphate-dependent enzyme [Longibaculum muris]|uniref:homocysteine desulfhydrase n=1 Tax=Longibaculum muris TaxID=1796628 RepID=A0A4R3Z658_9FIRM|nr:aminotransferase class I/II-fold pyridoxal phosphate-dependent enzyme [Longibaculum muris]KXU52347.1 putative cystathionine beta-lyase [Candidatus Stoquefichus sp. KLE1796]MBS5367929.1 aminotransferase class I/II-fold pyridoxal phosphate-dependent enzyme [Coprobacillus cateniformis]MCR1887190.1 aminotransferase class I/II-fold pyridoxal phosphate-dependent enzyme [Longibaculum muris]MED9811982.1 aminotransferase class I/II-fold pyridoxal phosphate-dependent enzyme [Longibaculum muris]TCW022